MEPSRFGVALCGAPEGMLVSITVHGKPRTATEAESVIVAAGGWELFDQPPPDAPHTVVGRIDERVSVRLDLSDLDDEGFDAIRQSIAGGRS